MILYIFFSFLSDQSCDNIKVPTADDSEAQSSFKLIQEKILDKLVSEMWPSVCIKFCKLYDLLLFNLPVHDLFMWM